MLATVLDRNLHFEREPDAEARRELSESFPVNIVEASFRFLSDGEFDDSQVLPTVKEITGEEPRTFAQWSAHHAYEFR